MSSPFTLGTHSYRAGRLEALRHFHVARRLITVLEPLLRLPAEASAAAVNRAVLETFRYLPDSDAEYVLLTCLAVVTRQQGPCWVAILSRTQHLLFADLGGGELNYLLWQVLRENFQDDFPAENRMRRGDADA